MSCANTDQLIKMAFEVRLINLALHVYAGSDPPRKGTFLTGCRMEFPSNWLRGGDAANC